MLPKHVPVLIIGGGPVGLYLSCLLSRFEIAHLLVEKHPQTTMHPKARGINIRSMELFRQMGIEKQIRPYELPAEARRFSYTHHLITAPFGHVGVDPLTAPNSPTSFALISQDWVELAMFKQCQTEASCDLKFNHKCLDIKQNADCVTATILNRVSNTTETITADYAIAADGAHSPMRDQLAIAMKGNDNLGTFCNIFCEIDLADHLQAISAGYFLTDPELTGCFVLSTDGRKRWLFGKKIIPELGEKPEDFTPEHCHSIVTKILGGLDLPIQILSIGFWDMAALIAEHYQKDRIFLAGDSAHRLPPTGGFGMNTGLQDAHNLAWKLAYVLKNNAGKKLLATYEQERLPVAVKNITWASQNNTRIAKMYAAIYANDMATFQQLMQEQSEHLNNQGLDLGFCYHEGALIPENTPAPEMPVSTYYPNTYPGSRAPHVWLVRDGQTFSSLDLFEQNFVLLTTPQGLAWLDAAKKLQQKNLPLSAYAIGERGEFSNPEHDFETLYQIKPTGAVLIRPDGHVAWRCADNHPQQACEEMLDGILRQILALP